MSNFIGRQRNVGLGLETVRGTAVPAEYWFPAIEFSNDDKIVQAVNESSYGVITDADDARVVKKFSEASLTAKADNLAFGLIALATLGGQEVADELEIGTVYDHVFVLAENAQHPTLTLAIEEPNATGANGLRFALNSVQSLDITAEIEKFVQYTANLMGNANSTATNTPAYVTENVFLPQHCTVDFYADYADLIANSVEATYPFRVVNLKIEKNVEDDQILGDVNVADRFNKQFVVTGSLEILYNDRVMIDDILLADVSKAMKISMVDTSVQLGTLYNPLIEIQLSKVKFSEVARAQGNNDIVKQTVTFKAFYDVASGTTITMRFRNDLATDY